MALSTAQKSQYESDVAIFFLLDKGAQLTAGLVQRRQKKISDFPGLVKVSFHKGAGA